MAIMGRWPSCYVEKLNTPERKKLRSETKHPKNGIWGGAVVQELGSGLCGEWLTVSMRRRVAGQKKPQVSDGSICLTCVAYPLAAMVRSSQPKGLASSADHD